MKKMRISLVLSLQLVLAVSWIGGCASERDLRSRSMERFVRDNTYRNPLKGYQLNWPNDVFWKHHRHPEFDLLFDHVDGNSQILVTASRPMVRQEFPDGFASLILDRLGSTDVSFETHEDLTTEENQRFQISGTASFKLFSREEFTVNRKIVIDARSNGKFWLAVMFISNDIGFGRNQVDFATIRESVKWVDVP